MPGNHFLLAQRTLSFLVLETVPSFVLENNRASHISHGLHKGGYTVNIHVIENAQKIFCFSQRSYKKGNASSEIDIEGAREYSVVFVLTSDSQTLSQLSLDQ